MILILFAIITLSSNVQAALNSNSSNSLCCIDTDYVSDGQWGGCATAADPSLGL
jgi:hypothetical protein